MCSNGGGPGELRCDFVSAGLLDLVVHTCMDTVVGNRNRNRLALRCGADDVLFLRSCLQLSVDCVHIYSVGRKVA